MQALFLDSGQQNPHDKDWLLSCLLAAESLTPHCITDLHSTDTESAWHHVSQSILWKSPMPLWVRSILEAICNLVGAVLIDHTWNPEKVSIPYLDFVSSQAKTSNKFLSPLPKNWLFRFPSTHLEWQMFTIMKLFHFALIFQTLEMQTRWHRLSSWSLIQSQDCCQAKNLSHRIQWQREWSNRLWHG